MSLKVLRRYLPFLSILLLGYATVANAQRAGGLQVGEKAPAFSVHDQAGKEQDLHSLSGPNGLLLVFFRSADWCPFCKGQLVALQAGQKAFTAKGIGVAAISYDSPAILADFTKRKSTTYPLLSDSKSSVIDAFAIRNTEATGIEAGIPFLVTT